MRKPRKSTLDAFIDQFAEFPLDSQERALDLMQFEHRRAQIRAKKDKPAAAAPPLCKGCNGNRVVNLNGTPGDAGFSPGLTPVKPCPVCSPADDPAVNGDASKLDLREPA